MYLFGISIYFLNTPITLFFSLLLEAFPFLLLGIIISSGLLVFVNEKTLVRWLPDNPILGAMVGSCLGLLLPVCEYGNIPVARRLLMQGGSAPVAIAFLLAAPTINPITLSLTWIAFSDQPDLVFLRVLLSFLIATIVGGIFAPSSSQTLTLRSPRFPFFEAQRMKVKRPAWEDQISSPLLRSGTFLDASLPMQSTGFFSRRWRLWGEVVLRELIELGSVLVIGSAIATILQLWFPPMKILTWGQGFLTPILPLMLFGFVLSTGSLTSAFFARHLTLLFNGSSLLAFLLFAPIVDIKGLFLFCATFRLKAVLYLLILVIQLTFLFTSLIQLAFN